MGKVALTDFAIDFDDVIFPFNQEFFKFHNKNYGTNVCCEDHVSYDYEKLFKIPFNLVADRISIFHKECNYLAVQPLIRRAQIMRLKKLFRLHIVTARADSHRMLVSNYVQHQYGPNMFEEVHLCNGFVVPGDTAGVVRLKSEVCASIGATYLAEDALHNAEDVAKNANIPVFLLDNPWNQTDMELSDVVYRAPHWEAVISTLEQLHSAEYVLS